MLRASDQIQQIRSPRVDYSVSMIAVGKQTKIDEVLVATLVVVGGIMFYVSGVVSRSDVESGLSSYGLCAAEGVP